MRGGVFEAEEEPEDELEDEPEDELEDRVLEEEPVDPDEDDEEEDSDSASEEDEDEDEDDKTALGAGAAAAAAAMRFGALARCSLRPSVSPPSPMAVQKLMAKRVFLGESFGKRPSNDCCWLVSLSRSRSFFRPMYSAIS